MELYNDMKKRTTTLTLLDGFFSYLSILAFALQLEYASTRHFVFSNILFCSLIGLILSCTVIARSILNRRFSIVSILVFVFNILLIFANLLLTGFLVVDHFF